MDHLMHLHASRLDFLAVPILLALWSVGGPLLRSPWPALISIVYFGRGYASTALANVRAPHEWDFGCFWLYGRLAAMHQNIYDPSVFPSIPLPFTPSAGFIDDVIRVGFPYPPPTIALFLPLGYFHTLSTALGVWYGVQVVALAVAAWMLARTFMPGEGWAPAVLIGALVLALPASAPNTSDAQTNYLLLLLIALAFAQRTTAVGAVWQLLAVWIKPYVVALFLIDVIRMNARRLSAAASAAAASLAGAVLLLGLSTTLTYFQSNPAAREPAATFVESVNQSLLAVLLRRRAEVPDHISLLHEPVYVAVAVVLLALTGVLCARAPRGSDLAFALCLLLGMLIYPATLNSYGVILIVPLLVLWRRRDALPGKAWSVVVLAALVTLAQGPLHVSFAANLGLWLCCAGVLFATSRETRVPLAAAA